MTEDTCFRLPLDILLYIGDHFYRDFQTLSCFSLVNHCLHSRLNPLLRRLKAIKLVAISGINFTSLVNLSLTSRIIHSMLAPVAADYEAATTRSRAHIARAVAIAEQDFGEDMYYTDANVMFEYADLKQRLNSRWKGMTGYPVIPAVIDDLIDTEIPAFSLWKRRMGYEEFLDPRWLPDM